MKAINQRAKKVMDTLTEGMNPLDDHKKIDNTKGTFMAVVIERGGHCKLGRQYSVAHYYEQNGDLMRDPDMEFIKGADGEYYPISFWQDAPPIRNEVVVWKDGEITGWMGKEQAELATFANKWMTNFEFKPLIPKNTQARLKKVCKAENITLPGKVIRSISVESKGDIRHAINELQKEAMLI